MSELLTKGRRIEKTVKIVGFATQGEGSPDFERLGALLSKVDANLYSFHRSGKRAEFLKLLRFLRRERPDLVVMEGTGIAGGLGLILAHLVWNVRYVVSSGDAVGPFVRKSHPYMGIIFSLYERILCRLASGFIGWTPYLTGRALTFGTRRAMTAPGWAPFERNSEELLVARKRVREKLSIPDDAIVIGIAGSLRWNSRAKYCYGYELVKALKQTNRRDVMVLVIGDGDGLKHLEKIANGELGKRFFLTGRVPRTQVPDYLAAMDVASLPQSLDGVGSFRYTTKIAEYIAVHLPIVTGSLPMTYDLSYEGFWRLPGSSPWSNVYSESLKFFMENISMKDIYEKGNCISNSERLPKKTEQIHRVTEFLKDLLSDRE